MTDLKKEIINELYDVVMHAIREGFQEEDEILVKFKEQETLEEDFRAVRHNNVMLFDIIGDKIIDALYVTIEDMIDEGVLTINED